MSKRYQGGILGVGFNPLQAPNAPTNVTAAAGDAQATVSFTAPTNVGGSAITGYTVQSNPGAFAATGSSSPITVSGLSNGTAYTFNVWALNSYGPSPAGGPSGSVTPAQPRAVFGGGLGPYYSYIATMGYVTISTTGNATSFGNLTISGGEWAGLASSSRGVFGGNYSSDNTNMNVMNYITIASAGNASVFGQLVVRARSRAACSNDTRGVFAGGTNEFGAGYQTADMDYITIATTGNSTTFGNLASAMFAGAGCASPTRGIIFYGNTGVVTNVINYITIATTGNATDFGDTLGVRSDIGSASSSTRGVVAGGSTGSAIINNIEYVTIATTGNATDFGDLTLTRSALAGASSSVRAVFGGGYDPAASGTGYATNTIDYITIATTGNATDFGDLTIQARFLGACSNAHGGL